MRSVLVFLVVLLLSAFGWAEETLLTGASEQQLRIFMLYSFNSSNETRARIHLGMQDVLARLKRPYSLDVAELNSLYDPDPSNWEAVLERHMPDIRAGKYDLAIVGGDEAAELLQRRLGEIPPETAVIFANVGNFDEALKELHPNITAVIREQNPWPDIRLGLRLFPATDELILLVAPRNWHAAQSEEIQARLGDTVKLRTVYFDSSRPESLKNMQEALQQASPHSFVVALDWDRFVPSREAADALWAELKKDYAGPVFVRRYALMEYALGGSLARVVTVGELTGEIIVAIAGGMVASDIPPVFCPEFVAFNAAEMKRFGIDPGQLPPGSRIMFEPPGWAERYADELLVAGVVIGVMFLALVAGVLWLLRYGRKLRVAQLIQSTLPVRVTVVDRDGNILFFHKEYGVDSRFPDEKYTNITQFPWIEGKKMLETIRRVFDEGNALVMEYDYFGEQRTATFARVDRKFLGQTAVMVVSSDSSALQRAQREALDTAKRFAQTLRSIGDAVIATDEKGNITMCNMVAEKLTGYTAEEAVGRPHEEIFRICSYITGNPVPSPVLDVLSTGRNATLANHTDLIARDGRRYHISDSAAPIRNEKQEIIGAILVFRDVTAAYAQRDHLNMTLLLLRQLARQGNIVYFRVDLADGCCRTLLDVGTYFLPVGDDGVIALREWLEEETWQRVESRIRLLQAGTQRVFSEDVHSNYGGSRRYFHIYAGMTDSSSGGELVGMIRETTLEEEQRQSYQETRTLLETIKNGIPFPIYLKDPESQFRYLDCNDYFCHLLRLEKNDIIGKTDYEILPQPLDADSIRPNDRQAGDTPGVSEFPECLHDGNGKEYRFRSMKQLIRDQGGKKILLGISIGISAGEAAQGASEERAQLLQLILDHLPVSVYVKDIGNDSRFLIWNQSIAEATGWSAEQVIGKNSRDPEPSPDVTARCGRDDDELFRADATARERVAFAPLRKEGIICDMLRTPLNLGAHKLMLGVGSDITEFCRLQERYDTSLRELGLRVHNAELVNQCLKQLTLSNDFETNITEILRLYARSSGAERGFVYRRSDESYVRECEWNNCDTASLEHYSLREMEEWHRKFLRNEPVLVEQVLDLRQVSRDTMELLQAENIQSVIAVPIFQEEELYGFLGLEFLKEPRSFSAADVQTLLDAVSMYQIARKQNQQSMMIREQRDLQTVLFDRLEIPMMILDPERRILAANKKLVAAHLVDIGELVGRHCFDEGICRVHGTDYCNEERCTLWRTIRSGQGLEERRELDDKVYQINTSVIKDAEHKLQYVVESFADISQINAEKLRLAEFITQDEVLQSCMEMLLLDMDFSSSLRKVVEQVNRYFSSSATAVMRYVAAGDASRFEQYSALLDDCDARHAEEIKTIYERQFAAGFAFLKQDHFICHTVNSVPAGQRRPWQKDADTYLTSSGLHDIVMIPIFYEGRFWGYISSERKAGAPAIADFVERMYRSLAGIVAVMLKRENLKNAMAEQIALQSQIFEYAAIPLLMLDSERKLVSINRSACELLHYSKDAIGQPCESFCGSSHTAVCSSATCPVWYSLLHNEPRTLEMSYQGLRLNFKTMPICDSGGKVRYVLKTIHSRPDENPQAKLPAPRPEPEPIVPEPAAPEQPEQPTVLVVDDVPMNLKVLAVMLRKLNCTVVCASSGAEALEILDDLHPRVVLTDIWMPGMNGVELGEALRNRYGRSIRLLAVTADVESGNSFDMSCFDAVLLKPVTFERLREVFFER